MLNTIYRFYTQTLATPFHDMPIQHQYSRSIGQVMSFLHNCAVEADIYLEITGNGILHYHTIYELKDRIKEIKTKYKLKRDLGFFDIQEVRDYNQVTSYCQKDVDLMSEVMGIKLPLTLKDYRLELLQKKKDKKLLSYNRTPQEEDTNKTRNIHDYI